MMFVPPSLTPLWEGVFAYFATNFQNFPFSLLMTWVNGEKSWSKLLMEQYKYHRSAFCDEYITVALVSWCREKVPSAQFRQLHYYVEPHSKPDRNKQGILLSGLFYPFPVSAPLRATMKRWHILIFTVDLPAPEPKGNGLEACRMNGRLVEAGRIRKRME